MEIIRILNNREIAVVIWLSLLFLWALSISSVRHSFFGILKAFFVKTIIVPLAIMLLYVLLMVLVFKRIGFWDTSALKDTILWTVGAFATFLGLNKVVGDESFFRNAILDNLKLVLILEFIVNLYSFNLVLELVLVPIVTFIVLLNLVAKSKPEYKNVRIVLDYALGLFGLVLIVFTFRELSVDLQNFATLDKTLRDFLLPALFTIVFLPYVYLMALYMQYERLFLRIDFANANAGLARYAKRKILQACHLNLSKVNKCSKNVGLPKLNGKDDVLALIRTALNPTGA
ncbi:MAG: hypothetical protein AABO57_13325 [Acidobacteriota bacterium]